MDVSGSMGREQKDIVRIESFWIDTWLRSQYKGLEVVYIVHDAVAKVVDQESFFHLRESGGIEADADVVMLLARGVNPADHARPGEFNGELDVYIDKNRQGRECQLSLPWRAHYATIG
jgi:hypothetical protein